MVKFKGKAQNVVNMKDKPIKKGFKLYVLCDNMNGFCINILPYIGKDKFPFKFAVNFLSKNLNKKDFLYMDR